MGEQKALVVGVSNYRPPLTLLPGVANDARAMAELLGSPHGHFHNSDVTVLTDIQASGAAVKTSLAAVLGKASPDDTVFVYMAGHGTIREGAYYYVAHDTAPGREKDTGVPLVELRNLFDACPSRRVFVWLDFCHSGGVIERSVDSVVKDADVIERTLRVAKGIGKMIVAACTAEQTAKEPKHGSVKHGLFTLALLDGLRGQATNSDGAVTASSLYEYVVKRVESESIDQCPVMYGHMQGSIVLMYYGDRRLSQAGNKRTEPEPALAAICESSGHWVMVGNLFFPSLSVNQTSDRILIEVRPRKTEEYASIQRLRPRDGRGDAIAFAHGNEALVTRVADVTSRSADGQQTYTIALIPENVSFGGHGMEASVQGHSPEEIAEKRARRLLLNSPPAPGPSARRYTEESFVEMYIRGSTSSRYHVDRDVLSEFYAAYKQNPELILPLARLKLLYALRASECVEEVLELRLGPIQNGNCHVRFRGRRARRYSNVEPHVIEIEGDCRLD